MHPGNGRKTDKEKTKYFKPRSKIEVADIKVEKNTTYVMLNGSWYNSVQFDFVDEREQPINIYQDAQYNPYIQYKMTI